MKPIERKLELGDWIFCVADSVYGKVIHIYDYDDDNELEYTVTIKWLDGIESTESVDLCMFENQKYGKFDLLGKMNPKEELVFMVKNAN